MNFLYVIVNVDFHHDGSYHRQRDKAPGMLIKDHLNQANEVGRLILKMELSPGLKRKERKKEKNNEKVN